MLKSGFLTSVELSSTALPKNADESQFRNLEKSEYGGDVWLCIIGNKLYSLTSKGRFTCISNGEERGHYVETDKIVYFENDSPNFYR